MKINSAKSQYFDYLYVTQKRQMPRANAKKLLFKKVGEGTGNAQTDWQDKPPTWLCIT